MIRRKQRTVLDLNGSDWRVGRVPRKAIDCPDAYDCDAVTEWLPATVPGNVRSDLMAVGRIPDLFYGTANQESQWVDDWDWWYRKEVALSLKEGERAFLVFEGIDYISAVYFDGLELGRHEGMFSRQVYEITEALESLKDPSGFQNPKGLRSDHLIAVRLWGSASLPRPKLSRWQRLWARLAERLPRSHPVFPDRIATLKCQMSFGWDFAPRARTMGLWDDVYVVVTRSVFIEEVFARYEGPGDGVAPLRLSLDLDADRAQTVKAVILARGKNFEQEEQRFEFDLALCAGHQAVEMEFAIENPRLWQPWDRGRPDLYLLEVQLFPADAASPVLDALSTTFGLRTVERAPNPNTPPEAEPWVFVLNGRREFIRGANWVPADALPGRVRREDYAALIDLAKKAHINMLRVWGGGLREKRAFYDLCDQAGIMVWQEFPFACVFLGYLPRGLDFLSLARQECEAIVRWLRHHPCLALWCGGNEYSARRNRLLVETLRAVVAHQDGTRPFQPASPGRNDSHNWRIWHSKANFRDYRKDLAQFATEFGLQSAPDPASLREFIPSGHLWPPAEVWRYHCAQLGKLERYARLLLEQQAAVRSDDLSRYYPPELVDFVNATQRAQALGLQVAIEHVRRRKYEAGGTLIWQFNEPWPAICWSVLDYWRRPKLAYERLKDLYNPLFISLDYPLVRYRAGGLFRAQVWAINDLLDSFEDCRLSIRVDGQEIFSQVVSLPPDSCRPVGKVEHTLAGDGGCVEVKLFSGDRLLSRNEYDLGYYDAAEESLVDAFFSWTSEMMLR